MLWHSAHTINMSKPVPFGMVAMTRNHRGNQCAKIFGIHLPIASHDDAYKWALKVRQEGLVACINSSANTLSIQMKFNEI